MRAITFIYKPLIALVMLLPILTASAQINVRSLEKSELEEIFQSAFSFEKDIDSVKLIYYDYEPRLFVIYNGKSIMSSRPKANFTIFDLDYEGDLLFLRTAHAQLHENLRSLKLKQENWSYQEKHLGITISPKLVRFSNPQGILVATAKPAKIKALEEYLTKNYNATITPPVDSILIVQAIVEKETGALGQKEILRGEKGPFYDFVFGKDPKHEKYMIYQGFFKPKIMSGRVWRSFADIYVRLNPDGTFTVSTTAVGRKFMIKDYKDDPDNPIFRLYD